jgi:hypothetical protein
LASWLAMDCREDCQFRHPTAVHNAQFSRGPAGVLQSAGTVQSGGSSRAQCWPGRARGVDCAVSAQRVSGAPGAGWLAVLALECAAEGFLGVVADPAGDGAHTEVGGGQQVFGEVHAPLGEVADGGSAEDVAESGVEHRPLYGGWVVHAKEEAARSSITCPVSAATVSPVITVLPM